MKRIIIILVMAIQSVNSFGQNKMLNVEYEIFYNTDIPNTQYANLFVNGSKEESIYIKKSDSKVNKQVKREEDNSISITYKSKRSSATYFNFKKDTLISSESVFGEEYLITEKTPKMHWELIDETKVKDAITLSKAICEFRGRKYIAWYALEFPLKYGPWKLHGLPGLIFEVYDETKRYNWYLKKLNYETLDESVFVMDTQKAKIIDIKEYAKIKYNTESTDEKLLTKMPRGTTIVSSQVFRNGLEIKFEWEK
ncbi:GLPGLI family protein [Flavobacterium xanthum]|uniref:GLPGLI family protein n=1 Tax=Flavobacterium xanthum TaxID=69322 RepID=A0A1M7AX08_9FLAO|nr:GLPGLI family protein [Flavobacterium xanthum]SHL47243.1 GLPGLI family protein [Flavobacterium xanthum]